ncbi:hypothetical protein [Rathayibacter toxicus]|uniref:hypothetical protein n=1 Tax=Rathayibacter toxicus TaxID=145458 RepID=UPI001C045257|nr:hypothetical protein [Rathayibacter toxicus]QWL32825.1 hypothetical protein E2R35_08355 [Rathayibacter toxicus]QWL34920.1 hypothetical protein E2R36_08360 [Rathayibacter toxicus]QWL37051.1 hypothetical protein E2R37_08355 [Rathayibacter toxicus]QWL39143.1 hypothetical protein E2R38_08350 [Rathayibacter toxicus]QWL41229.1 hypothetical protein E2R39_08355 [Rathayibacter toxicus]
MAVLERVGRYGWHSIDFGPLSHIVQKDNRPWEHRRVLIGSIDDHDLRAVGWEEIGRWFLWRYFARPVTGERAVGGWMLENDCALLGRRGRQDDLA